MILLVVDMQSRFGASNHDWLLEAVERELLAAREAGWGIMFLEYTRTRGQGGVRLTDRTHARLTRVVADYEDAITVHKEDDDGSAEALHAARSWYGQYGHRWIPHKQGGWRVVGVNTEACVAGTVNGLTEHLSEHGSDAAVTVVGGACNGNRRTPATVVDGGHPAPNNHGQDQIVTKDRNVRILSA